MKTPSSLNLTPDERLVISQVDPYIREQTIQTTPTNKASFCSGCYKLSSHMVRLTTGDGYITGTMLDFWRIDQLTGLVTLRLSHLVTTIDEDNYDQSLIDLGLSLHQYAVH